MKTMGLKQLNTHRQEWLPPRSGKICMNLELCEVYLEILGFQLCLLASVCKLTLKSRADWVLSSTVQHTPCLRLHHRLLLILAFFKVFCFLW